MRKQHETSPLQHMGSPDHWRRICVLRLTQLALIGRRTLVQHQVQSYRRQKKGGCNEGTSPSISDFDRSAILSDFGGGFKQISTHSIFHLSHPFDDPPNPQPPPSPPKTLLLAPCLDTRVDFIPTWSCGNVRCNVVKSCM